MEGTLVVAAVASFAAGILFLGIGLRLKPRASAPEGRPLLPFSVWWSSIGAATIFYGMRLLAGAGGLSGPVVVLLALGIACTGLAMWGLIAYLVYIYKGSTTGSRAVGWAYGLLVGGTIGYIAWTGPHTVSVQAWTVEAAAASPPFGMDIVLTLAFLVPPIVAGGMILRLLPLTQDAEQRRRILAVGIGIPLWVLVHLAARLGEADAWQFFARVVLGVGVALTVSVAYGVGPRPRAPAVDFQQRIHDLI